MTNPGALCATTQGSRQSTCTTLEDILINMLRSCPRERTRVIAAEHVQRGGIGVTVRWTDHRHEAVLVKRAVIIGG
jgi:hypothetical protein